MSDFAASVAEFSLKAKANMDRQVREITFALFSDVIRMSPVGNPELWASNAHNVSLRNTYTTFADAFNADETPGKRRISTSRAALDKKFGKLAKPKGYVGGRFRANWNTSVTAPDETVTDDVDPTGAKATANVLAKMGGAGAVTYLTNGLPYGEMLEYHAHSKQAPAGFVRVSMARIDAIVSELK
jgi:hypothetical protein